MYIELMKKNQNAQQMDSGLNLIAAGFSNSPATRAALINASAAGGHGGMTLSASDMINFQKQQQAVQDKLIRQQALPALMKQYNMTAPEIQALESSGKLDEVLQNFATRSLAHVVDANTGQTHLVNDRAEAGGGAGKIIATIGGEKEDPTQWVDGPNGPELHNSRTGEVIGGKGIGLKPTDTKRQFDEFNASLVAGGKPPIDEMTFLKMVHPGAAQTNVNVSPSGATFPKPEEGYAYLRNPDNTVKVDAEGKPQVYAIPGSVAEQEKAAAAKKDQKGTDKEIFSRVQDAFTNSNIGNAVKIAMDNVGKYGVVGVGSEAVRSAPQIGGLPHNKFDGALKTIGSNITIDTLNRMRQASPTGGALGNVSDFEDKMLQSVIAPLAVGANDVDSMKKNLIRIQAGMETLAARDFGGKTDPEAARAKFLEALNKREAELTDQYASKEKPKPNVVRIR
jgi:hypothetical protein